MNKYVSPFGWISLAIFLPVLAVQLISRRSVAFADTVNSTVSQWYRRAMAHLTSEIPISLFEVVIALIPVFLTIIIILAVRRSRQREGRVRLLTSIVAIALLLWSGNAMALGVAYNTTPLAVELGIPDSETDEDDLAAALGSLIDEVNALAPLVDTDGASGLDCTYSMEEISEKICISYEKIAAEYGFPDTFRSNAKPVYFSNIMSYFALTGIYTYYTGEANVNVAYPTYNVIFTAAHELSHQRGVLRENEANFMAYLVNSASDDPNLRYSAALNMLEYIASALYRTCPDRYFELIAELCETARADITASGEVSRRYGDTVFSDISRFVNDLFLKSNGTPGVVSYGMVTELAIDYFKSEGRIPSNDQ